LQTSTVELNHFADLTDEEIKKIFGLKKSVVMKEDIF